MNTGRKTRPLFSFLDIKWCVSTKVDHFIQQVDGMETAILYFSSKTTRPNTIKHGHKWLICRLYTLLFPSATYGLSFFVRYSAEMVYFFMTF